MHYTPATPMREGQGRELELDQAGAALAGAAAVHNLVAEYRGLRSRVREQERELAKLRQINEKYLGVVGEHCIDLADRFVQQLEQIDRYVTNIARGRADSVPASGQG